MTKVQVRAVVFDIDDTLMPEREYVRSGYRHVSRWLASEISVDADTLERELWEIFASQHRSRAYDRLLELHGIDNARLVRACVTTYREHTPDVSLSPEAAEVLEWCLLQGPVGIVTDGPREMQAAKANALGLFNRGIQVVLTDALGGRDAWKPSPLGMLQVCRQMNVAPQDAVYVGDNPTKDFLAARAAGLCAVRYRFPGQLHAEVEPTPGAEADLEIHHLSELQSVLTF